LAAADPGLLDRRDPKRAHLAGQPKSQDKRGSSDAFDRSKAPNRVVLPLAQNLPSKLTLGNLSNRTVDLYFLQRKQA
jgi:hypothetical protein